MRKRYLLLALTLVLTTKLAHAQFDKALDANINYTALGGNVSFSNLTPSVFYGWRSDIAGSDTSAEHLVLRAGPFASAQPQVKDSSEFLPGLMLPGNAGIEGDLYYFRRKVGAENGFEFMLNVGFGLKVMSNFLDSSNSIWQNNFRAGTGIRYGDLFMVTGTYTWANHNISSLAEDNFSKTFGDIDSKAQFLNITLQLKVSNKDENNTNQSYIIASWRSFQGNSELRGLPNDRILSFGFRKNIDFSSGNSTFI